MTEPKVTAAHRDSPYFGLDYYDEQFGAWFFGREAAGGKIIANLRAARLTLLHAESGVGKTSLLRAGVAWRLRKLADDMFARGRVVRAIPIVFSSWKDDPATELAAAVGAAIQPYLPGGAVPALPADRLDVTIEAASDAVNASLLIMLDQFEEYFLYQSREPVPGRFADELARCVNRTDLRANFLIAIREDAYASLGDLFKGRIANVYGNYLHVDYLDRASAENAIREPLEVYNRQPDVSHPMRIDDDLVEVVLDQVRAFGGAVEVAGPGPGGNGSSDRVATPLLQLVMQKVWETERAEGSDRLRLSTLERLRGVKMIVDAHLGKALDSLTSTERHTAIDMFDHLVTPSGGKIAESVSDLAKRTGLSEDQVSGVLNKLDREFIVRPIPAAPGQDPVRFRRYEIFHDVLAPTINRAIAAREEQRRVRRIRRLAGLAITLLVIVSAVAVVFAYLLSSANTEKLTAESRQLAAEADLNVTHDPELSAALALQALRLRTTREAADALRAALPGLQALRSFDDGSTVYSAAFDPADQEKVVSGDFSGRAWIWDVKTGQRLVDLSAEGFTKTVAAQTTAFEPFRAAQGPPSSSQYLKSADAVAFNPAGTEVAVGYANGSVTLFDARSGRGLESATVGSAVTSMEFVKGTGDLAIATQQDLVVWHARSGPKCCQVLSNEPALTVAVDPRNPQELAITRDGGVIILNSSGAGLQRQLPLGAQGANDVQFSPDGTEVVIAAQNGNVNIYQLATGRVVTSLSAAETDCLTATFSPDGRHIVAGYSSGTGRVWEVAKSFPLTLLLGHNDQIDTAQFSPDGSEVVTGSGDGTIRVWYSQPRELRTEITMPAQGATPTGLITAGYIRDQIIAADENGYAYLFTAGGKRVVSVDTSQSMHAAAWDRAGTEIASASPSGTVDVWHAVNSGYVQTFLPSPIDASQSTGDVAVSPDGARLAILTNHMDTVQVRSATTGMLTQVLNANNPIEEIAFSPDGQQIIGADEFGQVEVWSDKTAVPRMLGTPGPVLNDVAFNGSGSEFVTVSAIGSVTVWNAQDDQLLEPINACPSPNSAAFSPDDSKIVVACTDGSVRVFDAATGQTLAVFQATDRGTVADAAFSQDGTDIVAAVNAGNAGYVEIWSSELATSSLPALERFAEQRVTQRLTAAQERQYLNGIGG
jgi:WD40 repeat protein